MHLFNTFNRRLERFESKQAKQVTMYVCGPTVYDVPHLGHARSAYVFEVLRRYLEFKGYTVKFVRNVTDVDDKIIEKTRKELGIGDKRQGTGGLKEKCREVAERYLKAYHEAMDRLGIRPPDIEPKATDHVVPEMTDLIGKLLVTGSAYEANGDVYFAVRHFPGYGRLSNRSLDELQTGVRVEPEEHKRDPLDFALWKAAKPDEPFWESPWGKGRPGWHIECSAMSTKYLGDSFDIHGGGLDLIFPHHENEIAQSTAAGSPFAKYWVHHGLLTVNGEKMSKSLGNFLTLDDALKECGGDADALKIFFLGTHYRNPIDYTVENLRAARKRQLGVLMFLERVDKGWRSSAEIPTAAPKELDDLTTQFGEAMDGDLNTPQALAVLDSLVRLGNEWEQNLRSQMTPPPGGRRRGFAELRAQQLLKGNIVLIADTIQKLGSVLGLFQREEEYKAVELTPEQHALLDHREEARKRKDFRRADQIRQELGAMGLVVEDTEQGPIVRRKR